MNWRLKIGRVVGIDIFVHWTFILAPLYVVYIARSSGIGWPQVAMLMVLMLSVFTCVLMHEFGHAIMAKRFKVQTKDIIITPIGGLARLAMTPRRPGEEFFITLAGPVVNLGIGLALLIYLLATNQELMPPHRLDEPYAFPKLLLWANLLLFAFNLIPAFPMDGGRILRSSLAFVVDYRLATRIASLLGQLLALVFIGLGIYWQNYAFSLIGVFVFFAARSEIVSR